MHDSPLMSINTMAQTAYHSALWDDFSELPLPLKLAHYTSLASLESILKSREIWFSNPLYMNDLEELRFGMQEGARAFRSSGALREACGDSEKHDYLLTCFNNLFGDFENDHALDVYVLCLSKHQDGDTDGVLSMWRGYGGHGTGAALILDTSAFPKFEELPFISSAVEYATQAERRQWISTKVAALAREIAVHSKTNENLNAAAHYWFERLKMFAVFTKHEGFKEEREWRIVYMKQRDTTNSLVGCLGYSITVRGVEPRLKLSLDLVASSSEESVSPGVLLSGIVLGPSQSSFLAQASVRRMVSLLGFPGLSSQVTASQIPFRT